MALVEILLAILLLIVAIRWFASSGHIKGIPEPPGDFIIGHLLRFRTTNIAETFLRWKGLVGPVFQVRAFNIRVVVFNDKASISKVCAIPEACGRPRIGVIKRTVELFGSGAAFGEGPFQEEQRNFYLKSFRTFGIGRAETEVSIQEEVGDFIEQWKKLEGSGKFQLQGFSSIYAHNALWSILASTKMESKVAKDICYSMEEFTSMEKISQKLAFVSLWLMDKFTNAVQEKLKAGYILVENCVKITEEHERTRVSNQPRDLLDQILDKMDVTEDPKSFFHKNNFEKGFMIHEIMAATVDTTSRTLEWFMYYMSGNPQVAAKLHAEIDRVLDDLQVPPSLAHRDQMPYVQACILETLRLSSVVPLGVPHKAMADFQFNGATIPKDTLLIMNIYGVHHDPAVWDRPEEFTPERFLTADGAINVEVKNRVVAFGAGRRMCLGYQVAMDMLFIFVTSVFHKFHVEVINERGNSKRRFGLVSYPPKGLELKVTWRL